MEINCPFCDEVVLITDADLQQVTRLGRLECPFCQQHIEFDEPESPPVEKPPPIPVESARSAQAQSGEKVFFQGGENGPVKLKVLVTDKRVVLGSKTYALKQITSVGRIDDKSGQKTIYGINIGQSAIWCWFGWIVSGLFVSLLFYQESNPLKGWFFVFELLRMLAGIAAFSLTVLWCFFPRDIRYWVEIGSASGKEKALLCNTQEDAQEISDAINDAIIDN
jgi:hypothetical protein